MRFISIIVAGVAVAALVVGGIAIAGAARGGSADLENRARTVPVMNGGGVTVKGQQPNSQAGATDEVGDPQSNDDRSGRNDEPDENEAPEGQGTEAKDGARQANDDRSGRHDEPDEREPDEAGGP